MTNGIMPTRSTNRMNQCMQLNATNADKPAPSAKRVQSIGRSLLASSAPLNRPDKATIGTAIKNENLAEATRLNPSASKAVMVTPEREVPELRRRPVQTQ